LSTRAISSAVVFGARPGGIGTALAARLPRAMGVGAIALAARTPGSVHESAARLAGQVPGLATLPLIADLSAASAAGQVLEALGRTRIAESGVSYLDGLRAVVFAAGTVVKDGGPGDEIRRMHAIKREVAPALIRSLAEAMARNAGGGARSIVLVGSITALIPVPSLEEYGASNVALLELAQALEPLRRHGVRCTYCAPAFVRTDSLWQRAAADLRNPLARRWVWYAADSADEVAEETLAATAAGERLVVAGRSGRLLHRQYRLAQELGLHPLYRFAQQLGARWSGFT
jgi:short-subunit dehydrogenase